MHIYNFWTAHRLLLHAATVQYKEREPAMAQSKDQTRIGIIGATGYVGVELARILSAHPRFSLTALCSKSYSGKRFSDIYPAFRGIADQALIEQDFDRLANDCDIVITALPHGVSAETVPQLLGRGLRVLDHSGDFRYRDVAVYEAAYKLQHPRPDLCGQAVYGVPELYREQIANASLVSNPGCYPTCTIMPLVPLLKAGLVEPDGLIADAVSGISGAGRKADLAFSFCESESTFRPYGVTGHRHTSEIEQELSFAAGSPVVISFTPHLAPMKRGMLATIYAHPTPGVTQAVIDEALDTAYAKEPFVRLLTDGALPDTRNTAGTNFIDIATRLDGHSRLLKIFSALDNLGKGASAQAVQALNRMAGYPETEGLLTAGFAI